MVNKLAIFGGLFLLVLLIVIFMFTPLRDNILQLTIGQQFEPLEKSCQTKSDCESFLRSQGATNEDISNTNFRCNVDICEIEKINFITSEPQT